MKKQYSFALDFKNASSLDLPNIVSGDTGNEFIITITNDGTPVDLTDARVRLVIVNKDGAGSQDTGVAGNDIDMTQAAEGVLRVSVHADMISNGMNIGSIEVYTGADHETLTTTQNFNFTAKLSPSEKAAMFPSLIAAEKEYQEIIAAVLEAAESIVCVSGTHIDETGHLIVELDNGETVDAGMIGIFEDNVRFTQQTNSDARKAVARGNIDAAATGHGHGNITNDGKISGLPLSIVETDENCNVRVGRRIIVGTQDPSLVTGLNEGDIYLYVQS